MIVIVKKKFLKGIILAILIIIVIVMGFSIYNNRNLTSQTTSYIMHRPIERGSGDNDYIAFACNVDWGNEVIPDMLKILEERNIRITFFVTGRWVKAYPQLFEMIAKAGHEIGSHGYQHLDYSKLSLEQNKKQIIEAEKVIMKHIETKPTLFAPPSGAYNQYTLMAAEELGYKMVLWSIDTIDWRTGSTKDIIVKRVMDKQNHNGGIILMHPMPETIKAIPILIDELIKKNIKVGSVSDVIGD